MTTAIAVLGGIVALVFAWRFGWTIGYADGWGAGYNQQMLDRQDEAVRQAKREMALHALDHHVFDEKVLK
jgi:hypothetical protein